MDKTHPAISPDERVMDVITRFPSARKVFAKRGLDLCCGGAHSIREAALAHGVALGPLLSELNAAAEEDG